MTWKHGDGTAELVSKMLRVKCVESVKSVEEYWSGTDALYGRRAALDKSYRPR